MSRRAALNLLLALTLSLIYAHAQYRTWNDQLHSTTLGEMLDQYRGLMWLHASILSDFSTFPAYSRTFQERMRRVGGVSLADFDTNMVNTDRIRLGPANTGDDLGLHYIGFVLHKLLRVDRIVVGMMWLAIAVSWWCMFFFCFYAFGKGGYIIGALVPFVYGFIPELKALEAVYLGVWHPYGYVILLPLAGFAVKEGTERFFNRLAARRGLTRGSLLSLALLTTIVLLHLFVVALLLTVRSSVIVLLLPLFPLMLLEHRWRSGSEAASAGPRGGGRLATRSVALLCTTGLLGAAMFVGLVAPKAMVSDTYGEEMIERHVFWHTIWTSLGEFPNELQFKWSDTAAHERADFLAGHRTILHSREYEQILREDVVSTLRAQPEFVARVLVQKLSYRIRPFLLSLLVFGLSVIVLRPAAPGFGRLTESRLSAVWHQFYPAPYVGLPLVANRILVTMSSGIIYFYFPSQVGEELAQLTGLALLAALGVTAGLALAGRRVAQLGRCGLGLTGSRGKT